MKTLIVHAHPEPNSLNSALKDLAVDTLETAGHEVRVSDLYAMNWKATVDAADYGPAASSPLRVAGDSGRAFESGLLTPDVRAEQDKLLWADTIIFQFPLWWYSMPAILKGWFDRVFTYRFAYGVGEHSDTKYGERYGEGTLAGRRALLSVTIGGLESHYGPRGINGPIDDLLFPIHHGILFYPGIEVLPPFAVYGADRLPSEDFPDIAKAWEQRLLTLASTEPIPFRRQNFGDYELPALQLKPGLEPAGRTGFGLHVR
ncbi:NAD(P)H-dependent oxidoreductase [Nocardia cyriacigeorgica]|uniref:NAD(P)H-dependent oxidoreductase n=1 Tax=Nocardia cyriacigeorgica TaxID=135487 RepID=UPI0013D23752|nr:NAD(P)H-dependent oxidoreductase [Nocardia cyriacigeorgica]MBF6440092.1 NAD(P)H-dependent oxidoreductase [Nocardia cyriacigeorgica]MBF6456225.1 NAD(P)H-dependent oxidoreductase [Nocardia cyriacigeorgica]MBF6482233.1 NAD(P)H-dependent oxidoreductase [Nocardia cyriacigeorgica]MBF6553035.1 NAD(P)H-dependent oxidoreductase [Nocardia cyriacigeorgica]NEW30433.1 NAD(P)H-dependent oxidoreductase [Nocardia cyriacigeorgica]